MATYPMVGITGGVGCGKSEVGRILAGFGVKVVDADDVVHELLQTDADLKRALVHRFGTGIARADGTICRASLAEQVFADEVARRDLEKLIHPVVLDHLRRWVKEQRRCGPGAVLVPLLFEVDYIEGWDAIWCVSAKPGAVRERVRERGWSEAQLELRQAAQWPLSEKEKREFETWLNS